MNVNRMRYGYNTEVKRVKKKKKISEKGKGKERKKKTSENSLCAERIPPHSRLHPALHLNHRYSAPNRPASGISWGVVKHLLGGYENLTDRIQARRFNTGRYRALILQACFPSSIRNPFSRHAV
jgi:hypothetical protein